MLKFADFTYHEIYAYIKLKPSKVIIKQIGINEENGSFKCLEEK